MLDSLRPDFVGCYRRNDVRTPNMDRLAGEGVFFKNAYAEAPTTIPARTALLCGIYTHTNRPWMPLLPDDPHIAEWLLAKGFRTAVFGDGPFSWGVPGHNIHRGFEVCKSYYGKCSKPPVEYEAYKPDMRGIDFPEGCSAYDIYLQEISMRSKKLSMDLTGQTSLENITDGGLDFIEKHRDENFFLWLDYFEIHEPWDTPAEFTSIYGTDPKGRFVPMPPHSWKDATPGDMRNLMAHYKGCITQNDFQIGRILRKLDELAMADKTIVAVISDHGEPFGEHGTFRKFNCPVYDELSKIVCVMRGPGVKPLGGVDSLFSNVDYAPTICALAGVEANPRFAGTDQSPVLAGTKASVRDAVYTGAFQTRRAVRTAKWKYIDNMSEKENELFDMERDPEEKTNLAAGHGGIARELGGKVWKFGQQWANALAWRDHPRG